MHSAIQNDIKSFLDKSIDFNESGINSATFNIHHIFDKVAKVSLKRKKVRKRISEKKWFDFGLKKKRKIVFEKAALLSKYPHDPIIRGSYYKNNKEYAKLRKFKKKRIQTKYPE